MEVQIWVNRQGSLAGIAKETGMHADDIGGIREACQEYGRNGVFLGDSTKGEPETYIPPGSIAFIVISDGAGKAEKPEPVPLDVAAKALARGTIDLSKQQKHLTPEQATKAKVIEIAPALGDTHIEVALEEDGPLDKADMERRAEAGEIPSEVVNGLDNSE